VVAVKKPAYSWHGIARLMHDQHGFLPGVRISHLSACAAKFRDGDLVQKRHAGRDVGHARRRQGCALNGWVVLDLDWIRRGHGAKKPPHSSVQPGNLRPQGVNDGLLLENAGFQPRAARFGHTQTLCYAEVPHAAISRIRSAAALMAFDTAATETPQALAAAVLDG
jgi:hypothetical protein